MEYEGQGQKDEQVQDHQFPSVIQDVKFRILLLMLQMVEFLRVLDQQEQGQDPTHEGEDKPDGYLNY